MIVPRDYQTRAIEKARKLARGGCKRILLVSPTGSGKSAMGAMFAHGAASKGKRLLWLSHRIELCDQGAETMQRFGLDVGLRGRNASALAQVMGVGTFLARVKRGEPVPPCDLLITDEAHHFVADEWGKVFEAMPGVTTLGLTATPQRADGRPLGDAFDEIVVVAQISELTSAGHLVPLDVVHPGRLLKKNTVAQSPVDAYRAHAAGTRAILFAGNVHSACAYRDEFVSAGVTCEVVTGETPVADRRAHVDAFRNGRVQVLSSVAVLTEGFDAPATETVILARGCGSMSLFVQMVGRALRPSPGKARALLLDLRGVVCELGRPDQDLDYSLTGEAMAAKGKAAGGLSFCRVCSEPMGDDGVCPLCMTPSAGVIIPEVTGEELVHWKAAMKVEGDIVRAKRLGKWLREGAVKGHKPGAAVHKYRAVYGVEPTAWVTSKANEMAQRAMPKEVA